MQSDINANGFAMRSYAAYNVYFDSSQTNYKNTYWQGTFLQDMVTFFMLQLYIFSASDCFCVAMLC